MLSWHRLFTPTPPQEPTHKTFSGVSVSIRQLLGWGMFIEQCIRPPITIQSGAEQSQSQQQVGIHSLIHIYATQLLEAGTDISYIQKLLGHNNIKTTLLYTQVGQKDLKKVKSPLDNM